MDYIFNRSQHVEKTKVGIRRAKERGIVMGNPNGADALRRANKGFSASVEARKAKADVFASDVSLIMADVQACGYVTLAEIAAELNRRGIKTARGGTWFPSTVHNILGRLKDISLRRNTN